MGQGRGGRLIAAGGIVTFVGLCIVLVKVLGVPAYWVPLLAGLGLLLAGVIRRLSGKGS